MANARGVPNYSVGDFVQGGIVFWGYETGQHGLVCAKEDQSSVARWYSLNFFDSYLCTQARGNGPYAGEANTVIIIAVQRSEDEYVMYSARMCNGLQITEGRKTYGDWLLPSIEELDLMYKNRAIIDHTALENEGSASVRGGYYLSSSECNPRRAHGSRAAPMAICTTTTISTPRTEYVRLRLFF